MRKIVPVLAGVLGIVTACAPADDAEKSASEEAALLDDGPESLASDPGELVAANADEGVEEEAPDSDVDAEENAAWDAALADKAGGRFKLCSKRVEAGTYDNEWNSCGVYQYQGGVLFEGTSGDLVSLRAAYIYQWNTTRAGYVGGLDYQIWLKNDHGTIVNSGYQTTGGVSGGLDLRRFHPRKDSHPYVRILAGKNGDGRKSCLFRVYPCEKG